MRQEGKRLREMEKTGTKMVATNQSMVFQATMRSQITRLDRSAVTRMRQCCPLWSLWNPTRCPMGKNLSSLKSLFRVIILLLLERFVAPSL